MPHKREIIPFLYIRCASIALIKSRQCGQDAPPMDKEDGIAETAYAMLNKGNGIIRPRREAAWGTPLMIGTRF